ncbi:hypothetical protein ACU18_00100 [Arthrobacter sp. ZBG10]|uniref:hypothetical protein n=1 Tax=Arthrobacter sp. ZBG10 TaxID=1676590 RepID=UPI0006809C55|nr:hypothetical protein [Arthrobacter sp. ZBG10]KNH23193.1 hypothetical protein ACU18_00100 [Arthrobacter sp. ZBG10]
MASETGNPDQEKGLTGVGRRQLLRFGTLVTAFTGASIVSAFGGSKAQAASLDVSPSPTRYVPLAEKGAPLGVAPLDAQSKIPRALLPDLSGTYASKAEVNARDFGLLGDGTDETIRFQTYVNFLAANKKMGVLPDAEYRISAPINFPGTEGWGLRGMGRAATTILQVTDNVPIFNMGVGLEAPNTAGFRMWSIGMMTLRWLKDQPATNTNAVSLRFVAMAYQFRLYELFFYNGFYGQQTVPGQVVPWGGTWEDLYFNKLMTGGAINWAGVINDGPNNKFGRIFVEANQMVGPLFIIRGHNLEFGPLEIIWAVRGPKLFEIAATSNVIFSSLKLERAIYTKPQVLIDVLTQAFVTFGHLRIKSTFNTIAPTSGDVTLMRVGAGGDQSYVKIGKLEAGQGTNTNAYLIAGSRNNRVLIDSLSINDGWKLTNAATQQAAEMIKVDAYSNGMYSNDLGDTDATVELGAPSIQSFETLLTAPRSINLPSDGSMLTGGLTYEVVSRGAVNGANTITVKSGTRTITTIKAANYRVVLTWRRSAAGMNGWIVMQAGPRIT